MASALLMSHHAFRRDIVRFGEALGRISAGDASRADAVRGEWQGYRGALHGHHEMEDTRIFPGLREQHPAMAQVFERLAAEHRHIDPLLERGDRAFAALPGAAGEAAQVVTELEGLLDQHLAFEEERVVEFLRPAKGFPPPATDVEAELYAQGFAWSSHGVAQEVLDRVYQMLPPALTVRLPAARAAFAERCARAWGTSSAGASRTSVPER